MTDKKNNIEDIHCSSFVCAHCQTVNIVFIKQRRLHKRHC
jgi:hypothetical protein